MQGGVDKGLTLLQVYVPCLHVCGPKDLDAQRSRLSCLTLREEELQAQAQVQRQGRRLFSRSPGRKIEARWAKRGLR